MNAAPIDARSQTRDLALPLPQVHDLSKKQEKRDSVRSGHQWQPPEGIMPEDVRAVVAAAATHRDRLLIRTLWATGGRVSEVLALRPMDIAADALVLPNRKNRGRHVKRVFLPQAEASLIGELLLWARDHQLAEDEPIFYSSYGRKSIRPRQPLTRQQAWYIVKNASKRAGVQVLALRPSAAGDVGDPAPIHPHILRHARARQQLRHTKSLQFVQNQLGWSRLQTVYLTMGEEEARQVARAVPE